LEPPENPGRFKLEFTGDGEANWWVTGAGPVKVPVRGTLTFYVSSTGSDANSGLTAASPLATIQRALSLAAENYDLSAAKLQIDLTNGTYAGATVTGRQISASIGIIGNIGSPSACVISAPNAVCLEVNDGGYVTLSGVSLVSATGTNVDYELSGCAIVAQNGSSVAIGQSVIFEACAVFHIYSSGDSYITNNSGGIANTYTVSGGAQLHWNATDGGTISTAASTIDLVGTPNFVDAFAFTSSGFLNVWNMTFSGSATGSRYYSSNYGVIETHGSGPNYLPGNAAGAISNGLYN
jgi:hypothetical protein